MQGVIPENSRNPTFLQKNPKFTGISSPDWNAKHTPRNKSPNLGTRDTRLQTAISLYCGTLKLISKPT